MRISDCHWKQVEDYLLTDDRCVVPLGCTEQHAYLSLATDSILAERIAVEAAEPLGVPVFPVVPYGITPGFRAYPGTISLDVTTFGAIIQDILANLEGQGFRRVLFVNGHGGNAPGQAFAEEWVEGELQVAWHNWWNAPKTWAKVQEIDPVASHASWLENFPWTRLKGVEQPTDPKPPIDYNQVRGRDPVEVKLLLGDGNFGGLYERSDEDVLALWHVAVEETRERIEAMR